MGNVVSLNSDPAAQLANDADDLDFITELSETLDALDDELGDENIPLSFVRARAALARVMFAVIAADLREARTIAH